MVANAQSATAANIKKAVRTPGAKGAKGFLLWAKAALAGQPKVLSAVVNAAAKHVPSTAPGVGAFGSFAFLGRAPVKFRRRMGAFGQTGMTGATAPGLTGGTSYGSTGSTSAVVAGTPSTSASSAFANDILAAVTAAGAAVTTITGIKANLSAAQQGLPPVAIVPGTTAAAGGIFGTGTGPLGMSPQLFFFMLAGGAALLLMGEHDKKRHTS